MGQFVNSSAASANAAQQSMQARTQGIADRKAAYARAYSIERDTAEQAHIAAEQMQTMRQNQTAATATTRLHIAAEQMQTMRQNQTAATATTRLHNAASGFSASTGSKLRSETSTAQIFEQTIANLGKSYAIQDQNARAQANQLRKDGDDALKMSQIMSNYYSRVSKINSTAANWQLLGGSLSTIGDTMFTYNIGGAAEQIRNWGANTKNS